MISKHITCAFLYSITRYGYPPAADRMIDYIREMAELGFRSVELEGIGGEHLQAVANRSTEIRNALDDHGLSLAVFCTVLPRLGSVHAEQRTQALDLFRLGCETAVALGAPAVLDGMHLSKRCNEPATSPQNTDLPTICIPAAVR